MLLLCDQRVYREKPLYMSHKLGVMFAHTLPASDINYGITTGYVAAVAIIYYSI